MEKNSIVRAAVVAAILLAILPCTVHAEKVVGVSAGCKHILALTDGGRVYAWGANGDGQLGTGEPADAKGLIAHRIPGKVLIENVTAISAGDVLSLALKNDGTVWAWGDDFYGELGDGSLNSSVVTAPVQVQGLSGVIAIAAGGATGYALRNDGTVWAWGRNDQGQIGDGTTENRGAPVQVKGLTDIIALGERGTYAIKNDGSVWAWGDNTYLVDGDYITYGALGDSSGPGLRLTPFQVKDVSNVSRITSGRDHTSYLKEDGSVWSWGINASGQLGDGTIHDSRPPLVTFPSSKARISDVIKISATAGIGMALKEDGTVWEWGVNVLGVNTENRATPVIVKGLDHVTDISAGGTGVNVVVRDDGSVWGWGWDQGLGVLGNHHEKERSPVLIFSVSTVTTPVPGTVPGDVNQTPGTSSPVATQPDQSPGLPIPGMDFGSVLITALAMAGAHKISRWNSKK
jgi:alpha-tubulin suppressor-like RCC1 family protein